MRNDARPIGEHSPASPIGGHEQRREGPVPGERPDERESSGANRQSAVVNRRAETGEK